MPIPKIVWPEHWDTHKGWPTVNTKTARMDWPAVHRQVDLLAFTEKMGRPVRRATAKDIHQYAGGLSAHDYMAERNRLSRETGLYFPAVAELRRLFGGTYYDIIMSGRTAKLPRASLDLVRKVAVNGGGPMGPNIYEYHRSRLEFETGRSFPPAQSFLRVYGMTYRYATGDLEKFKAFEDALKIPGLSTLSDITSHVVSQVGRGNYSDVRLVRNELKRRQERRHRPEGAVS